MRKIIATLLASVSISSAAQAEGTHIYWLADNSAGFIATGDAPESADGETGRVHEANLAMARTLARLHPKHHRDTTIHIIDAAEAKERFFGTPRQLYGVGINAIEPLAPRNVCGDFTIWFASLSHQLMEDRPERAFVIVISPLIDIASKFCEDQGDGEMLAPELSAPPPESYGLKAVLTNPAVQGFIVIGYNQKQKAPWYGALAGYGGVVPEFVSLEAAPIQIPSIVGGLK